MTLTGTIGSYADRLDTGLWTVTDGELTPPPDITEDQLQDFHLVFGERAHDDHE